MLKSVFWHGKGNVERISERRKSSAKHSNAGASEGLESVNFKRKKERSALRCFFPFLVEVTGFRTQLCAVCLWLSIEGKAQSNPMLAHRRGSNR